MAMIDIDERRFDEAYSKLVQAIDCQKKARAANPRNPTYRQFLVSHLWNLARAAEGLERPTEAENARREMKELNDSDSSQLALDKRLAAVMSGKETTKDAAESLRLAYRASETGRKAVSARLFAEAFSSDPSLVENRQFHHRYNAACAAALAASGKSNDDPPVDVPAHTNLRQQSLAWLESELATWTKRLEAGSNESKDAVAKTMDLWKSDAELSSIRDLKELAKLSDEQRDAFNKFWSNVDQLLEKSRGK